MPPDETTGENHEGVRRRDTRSRDTHSAVHDPQEAPCHRVGPCLVAFLLAGRNTTVTRARGHKREGHGSTHGADLELQAGHGQADHGRAGHGLQEADHGLVGHAREEDHGHRAGLGQAGLGQADRASCRLREGKRGGAASRV